MCEMLYIQKATQNTRTHVSLFITVMKSHLLFTHYIPMFYSIVSLLGPFEWQVPFNDVVLLLSE